jgi:hypothetical protein
MSRSTKRRGCSGDDNNSGNNNTNNNNNKLRLDSTSDSSELLSVSAADRAKFLSVRRAGYDTLTHASAAGAPLSRTVSTGGTPGPASSSLVLSVLASTEGDRVDLTIDSPNFTAKEAIREVVLHLYGHIDERRHYGLATLDGALLGPCNANCRALSPAAAPRACRARLSARRRERNR